MAATERVSRIGVIGDVHARDDRLGILLDYLSDVNLDRIACVGDLVTGPGSPDRCVGLLRSHNVLTVRGNHDRWLLEGVRIGDDAHSLPELDEATVRFIRDLPPSAELVAADGTRILVCHGLGDNDMNNICRDDYGYALEANAELQHLLSLGPMLVLKGHRHRSAIWRIGELTLIDAGSLLEHSEACGVVIDFEKGGIETLSLEPGEVRAVRSEPLRPLHTS